MSNTQRSHSNKSDSIICIKALLGVSQSKLNSKTSHIINQSSQNKKSEQATTELKSKTMKTSKDATTEMPNVQDLKERILALEDANPDLP